MFSSESIRFRISYRFESQSNMYVTSLHTGFYTGAAQSNTERQYWGLVLETPLALDTGRGNKTPSKSLEQCGIFPDCDVTSKELQQRWLLGGAGIRARNFPIRCPNVNSFQDEH